MLQTNLIASGASESEIFIWDLNNPDKPMTPGAKAQVSLVENDSFQCLLLPVIDKL
jgi:hypothetical protein